MIIPDQQFLGWNRGQTPLTEPQGDTGSELAREWANPSVAVATVLMFVGGNVVHEALAQLTGRRFTPVAFSFGWPAYALSSLKGVLGEGRLLPAPDYPVKVFNLMSGYYRVNKNWMIGRIVRDHEAWISDAESSGDKAIRIAIFEATAPHGDDEDKKKHHRLRYAPIHLLGAIVMLLQLVIAAIPTIRTNGHEWGILAVTAFGTLLALLMGSLPQWVAEKMPNTRRSDKVFALTAGNGCRDVIIIKGGGRCPDLERLATMDSPITASPWTTLNTFSLSRKNSLSRDAKMVFGRPLGFQITRCMCIFQTLGWLMILVSLAGIRSHTWCLIAVGAIGLIYNSMLADLRRSPASRGLPLSLVDIVSTRKIMDGLMDLEMTHDGCGRPLLQEFFPGQLRRDEEEWWNTSRVARANTPYDKQRLKESLKRDRPRSMLPNYNLHATPSNTNAHQPQTTVRVASSISVTTNVESSAQVQGLFKAGPAVVVENRVVSPVRHQRESGPPQVYVRSPPISPQLSHPGHHGQHHDQPEIRTGHQSPPPSARYRPTSPHLHDDLRRQIHSIPWPAGDRIAVDIDDGDRASRGRNSPVGRVSSPATVSPIRHQQRPVTTASRRSTLSPPGADNRADRGPATQEERTGLLEEEGDEIPYPGDAGRLMPRGEQSVGAARRVSFHSTGVSSSTRDHGNDGDGDNASEPSLEDITEDMPKRPFWD